jgi:hypothetical protein
MKRKVSRLWGMLVERGKKRTKLGADVVRYLPARLLPAKRFEEGVLTRKKLKKILQQVSN